MSYLSDLEHARIEAKVLKDAVEEEHLISDPATGRRRVRKVKTWKVERELGSGGYGDVRLETCEETKEQRAVKSIRISGSSLRKSYQRELKALLEFSKPKYKQTAVFVEFLGWFEDSTSNIVYLATEWIPLGDLEDAAPKVAGALKENEVRDITGQILEGLSIMHQESFVHRDLKPKNILVCRPGPDWWIKLADFGLSKRRTEETAFQTQVGTQAYMAPEVLGYVANVDAKTSDYTTAIDLWALGCIVCRLVTGTVPFPPGPALLRFCEGPPSLFSLESLSSISTLGLDFVQKLVVAQPSQRLTSAQAVAHEWMSADLTNLQPRDTGDCTQEVSQDSTESFGYNTATHPALNSIQAQAKDPATTEPILSDLRDIVKHLDSIEPEGLPDEERTDNEEIETSQDSSELNLATLLSKDDSRNRSRLNIDDEIMELGAKLARIAEQDKRNTRRDKGRNSSESLRSALASSPALLAKDKSRTWLDSFYDLVLPSFMKASEREDSNPSEGLYLDTETESQLDLSVQSLTEEARQMVPSESPNLLQLYPINSSSTSGLTSSEALTKFVNEHPDLELFSQPSDEIVEILYQALAKRVNWNPRSGFSSAWKWHVINCDWRMSGFSAATKHDTNGDTSAASPRIPEDPQDRITIPNQQQRSRITASDSAENSPAQPKEQLRAVDDNDVTEWDGLRRRQMLKQAEKPVTTPSRVSFDQLPTNTQRNPASSAPKQQPQKIPSRPLVVDRRKSQQLPVQPVLQVAPILESDIYRRRRRSVPGDQRPYDLGPSYYMAGSRDATLEQLSAIERKFRGEVYPSWLNFISRPPRDPASRRMEYDLISQQIERQLSYISSLEIANESIATRQLRLDLTQELRNSLTQMRRRESEMRSRADFRPPAVYHDRVIHDDVEINIPKGFRQERSGDTITIYPETSSRRPRSGLSYSGVLEQQERSPVVVHQNPLSRDTRESRQLRNDRNRLTHYI